MNPFDEINELRAEVEHWKSHAEEAGAGFAQVCKDMARVTARNVELARERDDLYAEVGRLREEARLREKSLHACRKVDATLADQNAKVAAVAALAEEWCKDHHPGAPTQPWRSCSGCRLRAVLGGPAAGDDTEGTS